MTEMVPSSDAPAVDDADREVVITEIRDHCAAGRISLDELSRRVEQTLVARTRADLQAVVKDLPPALIPPSRRRVTSWILNVIGSSDRKVRWRPSRHVKVLNLLGDSTLDLREADFSGDRLSITSLMLIGTLTVIVPEGMDVDFTGFIAAGTRDVVGKPSRRPLPGVPMLRLRGWGVIGSVEVMHADAAAALDPPTADPAPNELPAPTEDSEPRG